MKRTFCLVLQNNQQSSSWSITPWADVIVNAVILFGRHIAAVDLATKSLPASYISNSMPLGWSCFKWLKRCVYGTANIKMPRYALLSSVMVLDTHNLLAQNAFKKQRGCTTRESTPALIINRVWLYNLNSRPFCFLVTVQFLWGTMTTKGLWLSSSPTVERFGSNISKLN